MKTGNLLDTRNLRKELAFLQKDFDAIESLKDELNELYEVKQSAESKLAEAEEDLYSYQVDTGYGKERQGAFPTRADNERGDELADKVEECKEKVSDAASDIKTKQEEIEKAESDFDFERYKALKEIEDVLDLDYTLIPEHEFEAYARQLAEDIGAIRSNPEWPYTCIDWEQATSELQQDYVAVEFDGTTYYYQG